MDWNYLSRFHKNPPTVRLKRHPYVQQQYNATRLASNNYAKYVDSLEQSLFGDNSVDWVLNENKFPYHFTDNTKHYVYWSKNPIIETDMVNKLNKLNKEYIYFENTPDNKSIPSIYHYHIFFRS